jgi:hypothetical protein
MVWLNRLNKTVPATPNSSVVKEAIEAAVASIRAAFSNASPELPTSRKRRQRQ